MTFPPSSSRMADSSELRLNVAAVVHGSRVNGPGLRAVVWVQGCTVGCAGCFNPETHAHKAQRLVDPVELARSLVELPGLDGITLSGGEPFEQAAACSQFAETVRSSGQNLMVFSGYPYKLLASSPVAEVQRLLRTIDLLVAGPYIAARAISPSSWRSSSNQELQVLTERGALALSQHRDDGPCIEVTTDGRGLLWSGFPEEGDIAWLNMSSTARSTGGGAAAKRHR